MLGSQLASSANIVNMILASDKKNSSKNGSVQCTVLCPSDDQKTCHGLMRVMFAVRVSDQALDQT